MAFSEPERPDNAKEEEVGPLSEDRAVPLHWCWGRKWVKLRLAELGPPSLGAKGESTSGARILPGAPEEAHVGDWAGSQLMEYLKSDHIQKQL